MVQIIQSFLPVPHMHQTIGHPGFFQIPAHNFSVGQGIQNMNLMLGLDERASLEDPGPWP